MRQTIEHSSHKPAPLYHEYEHEQDHDDFDFKPITEGLGFHQVLKTGPEQKLDQQVNLKISSPYQTQIKTQTKTQTRRNQISPSPRSAREIVSDFTTSQINTERPNKRPSTLDFIPEKPIYEEAKMMESILSWFIDMGLLGVFFIVSFTGMIALLGIDWRVVERLFLFQENIFVFFYLFLVFKFLYFSIFNLNASLGKSWLNLRLVTNDQYSVTLKQSCFRTFVGTLSLFAFGLPFFLGWVDKLTDTKIISLRK